MKIKCLIQVNAKNFRLAASAFHPFTDYLVNQHHLCGFVKAEETNGPSELERGKAIMKTHRYNSQHMVTTSSHKVHK